MYYLDYLVTKIHRHLEKGHVIPADLFAEAISAGLDVASIEANFELEKEID